MPPAIWGRGAGDQVSVGTKQFTVSAVRGDDWYSHSPVVWMTLDDWQAANPRGGVATVLAVTGASDASATDKAAATTSTTVSGSLDAIGSYKSENGSLTLMTLMLFAISALVIGAFFTVWTIQRTPDIATLKALVCDYRFAGARRTGSGAHRSDCRRHRRNRG